MAFDRPAIERHSPPSYSQGDFMAVSAASASDRRREDGEVDLGQSRPFVASFARFARKNELALVGAVFLGLVVFGAIFAPLLTPYNPTEPTLNLRLLGPSWAHPFGTDEFGRDLLARVLF